MCGERGPVSSDLFDAFYRTHYTLILRFVERRIDPDLAADICAECFSIAWRKFDPENPFSLAWLYQTARNLLGNAYRRRDRSQQLVERLRLEPPESTPADDRYDLDRALGMLGPKDREALQLTYWEGLSAMQVAEVLQCTEQAAWKRISRARTQLRHFLEEQGENLGQEDTHV